MNKPIACLFDFDGVVVDSNATHYKAWKQAFFQLFNQEIPSFPTATHTGKSPLDIAKYFAEFAGDKEKAQALYDLKGELLHASTTPPDLLPGVREITKWLQTNNIPFGIASNATRDFVKNTVQQQNLLFQTTFGFEDYKKPKPHPEPYILLAKTLEISESKFDQVWVFEDSITGVKAVQSAGMKAIGIETQSSREQLLAAGCNDTFPTLLEAFHYLEESEVGEVK